MRRVGRVPWVRRSAKARASVAAAVETSHLPGHGWGGVAGGGEFFGLGVKAVEHCPVGWICAGDGCEFSGGGNDVAGGELRAGIHGCGGGALIGLAEAAKCGGEGKQGGDGGGGECQPAPGWREHENRVEPGGDGDGHAKRKQDQDARAGDAGILRAAVLGGDGLGEGRAHALDRWSAKTGSTRSSRAARARHNFQARPPWSAASQRTADSVVGSRRLSRRWRATDSG